MNPQRGNALFIILIAVALLAALNFAVVKTRSTHTNASVSEQALLAATELVQHGQAVRLALDRMFVANGVPDTTPTLFAARGAHVDYGVPDTDPASEVFSTAGGGVYYAAPPTGACTGPCAYEFTGQLTMAGAGSPANPDLVMAVWPVRPQVCAEINKLQRTGYTSIPNDSGFVLTRFAGTYGGGNAWTLTPGITPAPKGYCYYDMLATGAHIFVYLLRAR